MILRWITLFLSIFLVKTLRFETEKVKENIEQGKLKYKEYKEASRSDKTGTCWANAIEVSLLVKMSGGSSITCLKS